ncbi:MAG: hypothetical protein LBK99_17750 [Opitutaceae bacterium]|jgi:hypothetical protein|nr:hypothetical protein [Opitutaceae bacterium]
MKLLAIQPAVTGITTIIASAGYTISPTSGVAQGWLIIGGLSLLTTISGIVANIAVLRRSKEAVRVAQPIIVEMKKEFLTKDDLAALKIDQAIARKFTGAVRKEVMVTRQHFDETLNNELRRIYDALTPLQKTTARLELETSRNREDIKDLTRRITP